MIKPCNMHAIFSNQYYVPLGDITKTDYQLGEMVVVDGITERIECIEEVDIETFENKYGNYLSQEQVAREYFVSTGTITSWIKKVSLSLRQIINLEVNGFTSSVRKMWKNTEQNLEYRNITIVQSKKTFLIFWKRGIIHFLIKCHLCWLF